MNAQAQTLTEADPAVGLSTADVDRRTTAGYSNTAPNPTSRSLGSIIKANTLTSFNLVIGSMWVLMFVARAPIQDSLFGFVIVLNSLIGIVQELRAKRTLERLSVIGEAKPVVRRDGQESEVSPDAVVLGDIVVVRAGDQIVVDGVVLQSHGLEADESLLTGEADPVHKIPGEEVMSGSFVAAGYGLMRATRVGMDAYATQLAAEAKTYSTTHSELLASIMRFVRTVTWVIIPLGTLLFITQIQTAPTWEQALAGAVAGIVTMVPEGLVLLTSVAMAVAVVRLGARQTLVQEMPAVEVLARVDVVCVDKTGTLTEPGMAVRDLVVLDNHVSREQCEIVLGAIGVAEANPNPTVLAIAEHFADPEWGVCGSVPFSSARKWSAAEFSEHGWWVLGAPEVVLTKGSTSDSILERAAELAASGARVVLLGASEPGQVPDADGGPGRVRAVALIAIDQVLRSDAAETVGYFLDQGVTVKVISGDNPNTVAAIAEQAGIPTAGNPVDARGLPDDIESLADVMETHGVFGRVTPAQKRAMVKALQHRGHTVAMTGDGVNDVLALKDSDLGIAMGSGAGATRAVAQLVLLTSSFAVLPHVVAEGRRVLGNIERVSDLFLTKSFYSALLSFMTVFLTLTNIFEIEFLFLPRHLTLITFFTIGTPAFLFALMPNSQRFRPGFFPRVLRFAVPAGFVCGAFALGSYIFALTQGQPLDAARTSAGITLFLIAWFVLLLVAKPLTLVRFAIVVAMGAGFLLVLVIPPLATFFALELAGPEDLVIAVVAAVIAIPVLLVIRRVISHWYPDSH